MPEKLSSEDQWEAMRLNTNVRSAQSFVDSDQQQIDFLDNSLQINKEHGASRKFIVDLENRRGRHASKRGEWSDKRDANLWRAQQHKNEHFEEYVETARQEAEEQGIHINLEQPKE